MEHLRREPESIVSGDTSKWHHCDRRSPAEGWALAYTIIQENGSPVLTVSATASTDGDAFEVTITAAQTAALEAGIYRVVGRVSNATTLEVYTVYTGSMSVEQNPATGAGQDTRSQTKRVLDNINGVIEARSQGQVAHFSVEGQEIAFLPLKDLLDLQTLYLSKYKTEVARERNKAARGSGRRILTHFKRPGGTWGNWGSNLFPMGY